MPWALCAVGASLCFGGPIDSSVSGPLMSGIDVLEESDFEVVAGLKVGLITNETGINKYRRSTIDLLAESDRVSLKALFSPDERIRSADGEAGLNLGVDAKTGLPVYGLQANEEGRPTPAQLDGLDALVYDIQGIGCRFYPPLATLGLSMESAAKAGLKFVVLDRLNPLGGMICDGPVKRAKENPSVAYHDVPIQHGMTMGELAQMYRAERKIKVDLVVVPLSGWNPKLAFDETSLPWIRPSATLRSASQLMLYPGVGLLDYTNLSVGRGTATPFEQVGAPWIHDGRFAMEMMEQRLPGVVFFPTRFTPKSGLYSGEDCGGVRIVITDRKRFRPLSLGMALMRVVYDSHASTFNLGDNGNVRLQHESSIERLRKGASVADVRSKWERDLDRFLKRREAFLLYPR